MLGSNYLGQAYYGQGPAVGSTFILHSVSATVTALGTIDAELLINHSVIATVTAVGSISRQIQRSISASVTMLGAFASEIVEALNIRKGATKFLNMFRDTNPVSGFNKSTKALGNTKGTRNLRTGQ